MKVPEIQFDDRLRDLPVDVDCARRPFGSDQILLICNHCNGKEACHILARKLVANAPIKSGHQKWVG